MNIKMVLNRRKFPPPDSLNFERCWKMVHFFGDEPETMLQVKIEELAKSLREGQITDSLDAIEEVRTMVLALEKRADKLSDMLHSAVEELKGNQK